MKTHFMFCPVGMRPHDDRAVCTCDPVRLAAAVEAERVERARVVERVTRVSG